MLPPNAGGGSRTRDLERFVLHALPLSYPGNAACSLHPLTAIRRSAAPVHVAVVTRHAVVKIARLTHGTGQETSAAISLLEWERNFVLSRMAGKSNLNIQFIHIPPKSHYIRQRVLISCRTDCV